MHIAEIILSDTANGPGIRLSLFVSGCTNCCKGCFQPETWDFNYGWKYNKNIERHIFDNLKKHYYQGITILGGEPFEPSNQEGLLPIIRKLKKELPEKDIWMYTGFVYDQELIPGGRRYTDCTDEILDNIDVLVDGRFEEDKKNIRLNFRGSENQRIIDMKKTREQKTVILSPLNN